MLDSYTKEELRKFLAENLTKSEDELIAAVTAIFVVMKTRFPGHSDALEVLPDVERLMRACIELPYEDFKDMVGEYVLERLD